SGHLAEDADPAASAVGARRHRRAHRPRTGAAEGRVLPDQLGAVTVPGARQAPHVGGGAAPISRWFARCEGHAPSEWLTSAERAGVHESVAPVGGFSVSRLKNRKKGPKWHFAS